MASECQIISWLQKKRWILQEVSKKFSIPVVLQNVSFDLVTLTFRSLLALSERVNTLNSVPMTTSELCLRISKIQTHTLDCASMGVSLLDGI